MNVIKPQSRRVDLCSTMSPCAKPVRHIHEQYDTHRRDIINTMTLIPLLNGIMSASARAAEDPVPPAAEAAASVVPVKPKLFIARDFLFEYPRGWTLIEDLEGGDSMADRRRQNVVRGEVKSPDGTISVSVIQQQASKLKQTLFQITSISQLGTAEEVSKVILPPGTKINQVSVRTFEVPSKNTGTVVGVIDRDPIVIYRYSAQLQNGVRSEIAAGVILGRILILGAGCPEDKWDSSEPVLKAIADSFKLLPR